MKKHYVEQSNVGWKIMKKQACILFIQEESDYNKMLNVMFGDLAKKYDVFTLVEAMPRGILHDILRRRKVQKITRRFTYEYYEKLYNLSAKMVELTNDYQRVIVLFLNSSVMKSRPSYHYLKRIKKQFLNSVWVMYYIDSYRMPQSFFANHLVKSGLFDQIYSYEDNYGRAIYWPTPYSKLKKQDKLSQKGVYFCGANKGRLPLLLELSEEFATRKIPNRIDLVLKPSEIEHTNLDKYNFNIRRMDAGFYNYEDLIDYMLEYDVILDIVQDEQVGLSLRPYEAVVYNKKLLTNNRSIFDFQFYNPQYMFYFEKVSDINWSDVFNKHEVDYHYQNEYSPLHLVEHIMAEANM